MKKNYYLRDAARKAKSLGFTDVEIINSVKDGIAEYDAMEQNILEKTKDKKKA